MSREPKLLNKVDPYTGAYYFQESLRLLEVQAGAETLRRRETPHLHDEIEMLLITEGDGVLTVNGVEMAIAEGSLAWLFPYHVHALRPAGDSPLSYRFCRYSLGMLLYLNINKHYSKLSISVLEYAPPCLHLDNVDRARAADSFEELIQENNGRTPDFEMLVFSCILRLVTLFERRATTFIEKNQDSARSLAWNILEYTHTHFNRPLDSAAVAELFHLSVSELNSSLRLLTGKNFIQTLNDARIRNACAMMQFNELSLPFIARTAGYSSVSAFYRQFKLVKGVTPDQYRAGASGAVQEAFSDRAYGIFIHICEHYREPITAETAAKALYLSPATVADLLEKKFHRSFSQLLSAVRIWVAAGLLLGTEIPICDIALSVGFDSVRTFTRRFTEEFGTSATSFRQSGEQEGRHIFV